MKKLFVFDFDDTLAHSEVPIYVKMSNGTTILLTPKEFGVYSLNSGDFFDFSEFNKIIRAAMPIEHNVQLLKTALSNPKNKVTILTARSLAFPISYWLKTILDLNVYVVAIGGSSPTLKSRYIEREISKGYDDIFFIDDSVKNIEAVNELKIKYPTIKIKTVIAKKEKVTQID